VYFHGLCHNEGENWGWYESLKTIITDLTRLAIPRKGRRASAPTSYIRVCGLIFRLHLSSPSALVKDCSSPTDAGEKRIISGNIKHRTVQIGGSDHGSAP
jgi:hypothetical protein